MPAPSAKFIHLCCCWSIYGSTSECWYTTIIINRAATTPEKELAGDQLPEKERPFVVPVGNIIGPKEDRRVAKSWKDYKQSLMMKHHRQLKLLKRILA
ncbi:hypothetical protein ACP70R_018873 [Stipagrostis hirtigluma subsp. patula]